MPTVLAVAIAGCSSQSATAPTCGPGCVARPTSAPNPALQERGLAIMARLGKIMIDDLDDCARLGRNVKTLLADEQRALEEVQASLDAMSDDDQKAFAERHDEEQKQFLDVAERAIEKCKRDPELASVLAQLEPQGAP